MRLTVLKQVVAATTLMLLISCGGGGSPSAFVATAPYIYAELDSFGDSNSSNANVYVVDNYAGNPITNATVTINGVPLIYNATYHEYEGNLVVAPGDSLTLSVMVAGNTYTASGTQFTSYPTITAPQTEATWPISCVNTITWSPGSLTTNALFYSLGVIDATSGKLIWPSNNFLQTLLIGATSFSIPGNSLTAGNDIVIVGITNAVDFSNAASGSAFIISGFNRVPVTVADVSPTLVSIALSPTNLVIPKGTTQQFTATGAYCDGTTQDLTTSVTWNSSDTGVAPISNAAGSIGKAITATSGITTISGAIGSITDSTTLTVTKWTLQNSGTSRDLQGVVWSGTQFVTVGLGGTILTSPDGVMWTQQASGTTEWLLGIGWSGTQFVAVGDNNILTSPDGITWTPRLSAFGVYLYNVTWSGTQFVAVGRGGVILTSPDGITWTSQSSGTFKDLFGIAWSGKEFVAVGGELGDVVILTSPDGQSWSEETPGTADSLKSVVWSGNQFVAVGGDDYYWYRSTFVTSPDAVTWTENTLGTGQTLYDIAWSGTKYVAVGYGGTIISSLDGLSWTLEPSGTSQGLFGVGASATKFVAVGGWGMILTYP